MKRILHLVAGLIVLAALTACGPSAKDRQAESLLAKARELSVAKSAAEPHEDWAKHEQALELYKTILKDYAGTSAAKVAAEQSKIVQKKIEEERATATKEVDAAITGALRLP